MRIRLFWGTIATILPFVAACGLQASTNLEAAVVAASDGAGLSVLDASGVSADRLCVLGPYTTAERFEDVTGVPWPQVESEAIAQQDSIELVAAIAGDEVVAWAEVVRPRGSDLLGGSDRCSA